jgi:hypothetical protein
VCGRTVARGGVIDLALGSDQGGAQIDIAAAVCGVVAGIGNGKGAADGLVVDGAQVITKEEQLVLDDWAAEAAAEVVVGEMSERPGEVGAGIDGVVLNELEGGTMELAGSGLESDVGDGTDGAAELGFIVNGVAA